MRESIGGWEEEEETKVRERDAGMGVVLCAHLAEVTVTRRRGGAVNGCPGEALPWPGFCCGFPFSLLAGTMGINRRADRNPQMMGSWKERKKDVLLRFFQLGTVSERGDLGGR